MFEIRLVWFSVCLLGRGWRRPPRLRAGHRRPVWPSHCGHCPVRPPTAVGLILARLEALTAGATPQVSRLLALSCRTAPAQGWTARDRLRMFGPIAGALDGRARACLQNDQRLAVMAEVEEAARAP